MNCFAVIILFATVAASRTPGRLREFFIYTETSKIILVKGGHEMESDCLLTASETKETKAITATNYINSCRAKDSNCLKKLLSELGPRFVQGIPEFSLPSIDPLKVPNYNQSDSQSLELSYVSSFTDIKYEGLSNFNISKFDIDLDQSKFNLNLLFPQVLITAYGVILTDGFGVGVNGKGLAKGTVSNLTLGFSLNATETLIKGKVHLQWKKDDIIVSFDRIHFEQDPSFTERKNYTEMLNKGLEEYPQVLYPQIQRSIKNTLGDFLLQRINFVHELYPVEVLYLPS